MKSLQVLPLRRHFPKEWAFVVKVHQSIIDENCCSDISKPDIYFLLMSNIYTCSSDNSFQVHVTKCFCEKGTYIFDKQQVLYEVGITALLLQGG